MHMTTYTRIIMLTRSCTLNDVHSHDDVPSPTGRGSGVHGKTHATSRHVCQRHPQHCYLRPLGFEPWRGIPHVHRHLHRPGQRAVPVQPQDCPHSARQYSRAGTKKGLSSLANTLTCLIVSVPSHSTCLS